MTAFAEFDEQVLSNNNKLQYSSKAMIPGIVGS